MTREKDKELYGELIRRYQGKLSNYLRKFTSNQDELEDILQEVFIKTYQNLYNFNTNKKFSPWIYRITHNEAVNHLKKYRKGQISLDNEEIQIIDENIDIIKETDQKITKEIVEKALLKVKEKYRLPLILYFFEQKTYEEIAEIMLIPVNTVGTLIMRGKKNLKENLAQIKF